MLAEEDALAVRTDIVQFMVNSNKIYNKIIPKQKFKMSDGLASLQGKFDIMKGSVNTILFGNLVLNILL